MTAGILDILFNCLVAVEDINGKILGELNRETVKELGVKQNWKATGAHEND